MAFFSFFIFSISANRSSSGSSSTSRKPLLPRFFLASEILISGNSSMLISIVVFFNNYYNYKNLLLLRLWISGKLDYPQKAKLITSSLSTGLHNQYTPADSGGTGQGSFYSQPLLKQRRFLTKLIHSLRTVH